MSPIQPRFATVFHTLDKLQHWRGPRKIPQCCLAPQSRILQRSLVFQNAQKLGRTFPRLHLVRKARNNTHQQKPSETCLSTWHKNYSFSSSLIFSGKCRSPYWLRLERQQLPIHQCGILRLLTVTCHTTVNVPTNFNLFLFSVNSSFKSSLKTFVRIKNLFFNPIALIYDCVCAHVRTCTCVHMHAWVRACVHACMPACVCIGTCVCAFMMYVLNFENMYI